MDGQVDSKKVCVKCGTEIANTALFCSQCGMAATNRGSTASNILKAAVFDSGQPTQNSVVLLGGFFIIGIMIGIAFIVFDLNKENKIPDSTSRIVAHAKKIRGPEGFRDIKFGMTTDEVNAILGKSDVDIRRCEGSRQIECDHVINEWNVAYFELPDIKSYVVWLYFYNTIGLCQIQIGYYAQRGLNDVLKLKYGPETRSSRALSCGNSPTVY
jgi:hypothetical protein